MQWELTIFGIGLIAVVDSNNVGNNRTEIQISPNFLSFA